MERKEIMKRFTTEEKTSFRKNEILDYLKSIQREIAGITFGEDDADVNSRTIIDVLHKYQSQIAGKSDNVRECFDRFQSTSLKLNNMIRAEISGLAGENTTYNSLANLNCQNRILKNVVLTDGEISTEIDFVVITPRCLTIVEVKNSRKDVFIDRNGDFYRINDDYQKFDSHILSKMRCRENLLRSVVDEAGFKSIPIRSVVVFTNNKVSITNKSSLRTAYVSYLPTMIERWKLPESISDRMMDKLYSEISESSTEMSLKVDFNLVDYRNEFCNLLMAIDESEKPKKIRKMSPVKKNRITEKLAGIIKPEYIVNFGLGLMAFSISSIIAETGGIAYRNLLKEL